MIAEVRGRGAGRGGEGQNGSVGRAARCLSPPPLVSAARPGRQQQKEQQWPRWPLCVASGEASALRPQGALSARNKWLPTRQSRPPLSHPLAESGWEALSAMLSHGAGLALWSALSLLQVSGQAEVVGGRPPSPPRTKLPLNFLVSWTVFW